MSARLSYKPGIKQSKAKKKLQMPLVYMSIKQVPNYIYINIYIYSPGRGRPLGLTRGTGSASEDHKSEDYKRSIGKLFLFHS